MSDDSLVDLKALREEAVEATNSEEWEDEYRRQFELAKKRYAMKRPVNTTRIDTVVLRDERTAEWPELSGPPAQKRWAITLKADRLKEIQSKDIRGWLASAWTSSKDWMFLHRVEVQYAEHRRRSEKRASALQAERQTKAVVSEAIQRQVRAAGITAEGLVELIDVSVRTASAPLTLKLAELSAGGRSLRVFEASNLAILMVIENGEAGRTEYAIERDEGLVADLKLFAHSNRS